MTRGRRNLLVAALVLVASLTVTAVVFAASVFTAVPGSPFATGEPEPYAVTFSPDGKLVAVADYLDNAISMFSVQSNGRLAQVASSPSGTDDTPESIAFSPDGTLLATANSGGGGAGTVVVYVVGAGGSLSQASINQLPNGSNPVSVAFSPAGKLLATANHGSSSASVFVVNTDGTLNEEGGSPFPTGGKPLGVAFNPAGTLLATANSQDGTVSVFSVQGAEGISPLPSSPFSAGNGPDSVAFSPNGALLATANSGGNNVSMFTVGADGTLSPVSGSPFAAGSDPFSVAFSPYGGLFAVANNSDSSVSVFSYTAAGALAPVPGSPLATGTAPHSVVFSPLGGLLATANYGADNVSVFSYPVGPPSATIASPASGATFTVGQTASVSFSCAEATYGPGLASCNDSLGTKTGSGGSAKLDTSKTGTFTYTVTATSKSGQTAAASISYAVNAAPMTSMSSTTSTTSSTPTPAALSASIGRVTLSGSTVSLNVTCSGGAPGSLCTGALSLSSRVSTSAGKVVKITADAKTKAKTVVRTETVGARTYTVATGQSAPVTLKLNATGAKLLAARYALPATLTVTGPSPSTQTATFRYPLVKAAISASWRPGHRATIVRSLGVSSIPAGATVLVICHGGGCPFAQRSFAVKQKQVSLTSVFAHDTLRPGTGLEIEVSHPGEVAKVVLFTVRAAKQPTLASRCLVPGASKPSVCVA